MRRKKLTALFLAASLILSGNTLSFAAEGTGTDPGYIREDGSFDYVGWDMDHIVENEEEAGILDKAPDNSEFGDFTDGTLYIRGTGTFGKALSKQDMLVKIGGNDDLLKKLSFGTGIVHVQGEFLNQEYADSEIDFPNLKELEFQQGHELDELGRSSFKMLSGLETVNVLPGKKSNKDQGFEISHYVFYLCENLSKVTLNNVWHLGKRSFYGDKKITSLDLGYLHHMRGDALEGCSGLTEIKVDSDNPYFETGDDGFLYKKYCPYYLQNGMFNIEVPALMSAPEAKTEETFKPRKNTKTIAYAALAGNQKIKSAKLISGVKQVQARAFYNCTSLNKLYISKSVKHIGNEAFSRLATDTNAYDGDRSPDDYDTHPYQTDDEGYADQRIAPGNIKEIYYGGSEDDWKAIIYDKYDKDMHFASNGGYVAENLKEIGLSENVIIHYNYFDEDIVMPVAVKKGGKISASCCAILAGSGKIGFDTDFLKFTPTSYTITPLEGSNAKGLKINKKMLLKAKNVPGSYDVTLTDGSSSMVIRIYVEKPVMKKYTADNLTEEDIKAGQLYDISSMLSNVTYLEPEKYESKKPQVAEISDTGTIRVKGKGSTKITVTICDKKFKAAFKVKMKKAKTSGKEG